MTRIVERHYANKTEDCKIRLWYSTHTGNGTIYFVFEDGRKAHEQVNLHGNGMMALFVAQKVLDGRYQLVQEIRKG